ncbi:Transcription factor iws1 [Pichia californica]|nr:Transcription factor iws1 [[Candida] californica]
MSSQEAITKQELDSQDDILDNKNVQIEEVEDNDDELNSKEPELLIQDESKELQIEDQPEELQIEDKLEEPEIEDQPEEPQIEDKLEDKLEEPEIEDQPEEPQIEDKIEDKLEEPEIEDQPEEPQIEDKLEDKLEEPEIEDQPEEAEIEDKPEELQIEDQSEEPQIEDKPEELQIEDKPEELQIEDKSDDTENIKKENTLLNEEEDDIDFNKEADIEEDISKLNKFKKSGNNKRSREENSEFNETGKIDETEEIEDEQTRKRREFEERFNALIKKPTKKRKNTDVDLEAMQDEAISHLKNLMKDAAYMDIDCVNNKRPATNKLKLLPHVRDTLLKSNLYDSILDNNLLEAVRIWLEPLPDASLPSFEIQKTLLNELTKMPIKTIHLRESGLGKVMIFYQKSKKVDVALKRIAEKLIGDWTRPVMGRSDNYRAREIPTADFDIEKFKAKTKLIQSNEINKPSKKSLYQESADRRKRAAAPEARSSVYTIAPQSNINKLQSQRASINSMGIGSSLNRDERFKAINRKLTKLSQKKKAVKKDGVSIEGRGLNV